MTSTAPTRPARNRQVSSHIANDDNSVGLNAAVQNLLSATVKPTQTSDSPTVVAESVPSNTVVSVPAVGEEPSHGEDEEADRIRRRYHRKKWAAKTKGKKKVFPSHTTFVVDPDINLRSAGLKELLSDEPSAPKTRAAVVIGVVLYAELAIDAETDVIDSHLHTFARARLHRQLLTVTSLSPARPLLRSSPTRHSLTSLLRVYVGYTDTVTCSDGTRDDHTRQRGRAHVVRAGHDVLVDESSTRTSCPTRPLQPGALSAAPAHPGRTLRSSSSLHITALAFPLTLLAPRPTCYPRSSHLLRFNKQETTAAANLADPADAYAYIGAHWKDTRLTNSAKCIIMYAASSSLATLRIHQAFAKALLLALAKPAPRQYTHQEHSIGYHDDNQVYMVI
ncbi:hypothetical protein C8J57DRAFT_1518585 [Mycena rebaudengoi]|nr:hypothetical protein C8J57DRAFT_1518585 [Mycena rebaudengoi]